MARLPHGGLPGVAPDQHRDRRRDGDRGAARLRHRLHRQPRPQRARAAVGARDRQHHRGGQPHRLRLVDRGDPDRDLDHPDRRVRLEQLPGGGDIASAAVTARSRAATRRRTLKLPRVGLHVFLVGTAILWLAPVGWAVFTSFRPYADTAEHGYVSLPHTLSIVNYKNAWTQGQIPLHFWNSMIVTIPAIVLILLFASSVAVVVCRLSFLFI